MTESNGDGVQMTLGMKLGLGVLWQPTPVEWSWLGPLTSGQPGAPRAFVLRMQRLHGVDGIFFDENSLRDLIAKARKALGGIEIASIVPPAPPGQR